MKYACLIYGSESEMAHLSQEEMAAVYARYTAFGKELAEAGVLRGGSELKPVSTATTVRIQNGKVLTLDGPFAETKEQLGGFYLLEVENLEQALAWAAKCPGATDGCVEVRPLGMGA
ncbi:MAG: YciI family protein [Acidobacteria bacterium]|nr:YciI family protein [Acidobacteriota bacterium]